jgi:hypothetical protein
MWTMNELLVPDRIFEETRTLVSVEKHYPTTIEDNQKKVVRQ